MYDNLKTVIFKYIPITYFLTPDLEQGVKEKL